MSDNSNLANASKAKYDEFYTQLDDIEGELKHYRKHFKDKVVFCNCDDPYESNFFKYFVLHFNQLKLKKLICTCYSGSPIMGEQISMFDIDKSDAKTPYKAEVTKVYDITGDGAISMDDIKELFLQGENSLTRLEGNGDFRSDECIEILKEADIVVTNPPFSLFREYVAKLIEYNKKFIIIGNQNAVSYKEIFPLIKDNYLWVGATSPKEFAVPNGIGERKNTYKRKDGKIMAKFGNICWFTNLDIKKRHEEMILFRKYNPDDYPTFDNYDAINVDVIANIPCDYSGIMAVPISILNQYNPDQFEIIGMTNLPESIPGLKPIGKDWCDKYFSQGGTGHVSANMWGLVYYTSNGLAKRSYARILIRNKHPQTPGGEE